MEKPTLEQLRIERGPDKESSAWRWIGFLVLATTHSRHHLRNGYRFDRRPLSGGPCREATSLHRLAGTLI